MKLFGKFFQTNDVDPDLVHYRNIMKPPAEFLDGFNWKTVIGAIFLGMVMMPASMYLSLFAGGTLGSAPQWVTIIIFAEIARRSLKDLKMQEVYILYYMAGLAVASPFSGLLWNQYFVQSDYVKAMGIAQDIPTWYAPSEESILANGRTFLTKAWLAPILLTSMGLIMSAIDNYGLGYVMYRITSDVEELPFPMAPVGASGIVALTESKDKREPWRWRCFSIGGMLGLIFGSIYIAVPAVTGTILSKPLTFIPIPFIDFTPAMANLVPATAFNLTLDLGAFLAGTVMPFWAVIGSTLAVVLSMVANPMLREFGILSNWTSQMDFINTTFVNGIDFYMSFGIGITLAVTLITLMKVVQTLVMARVARARDVAAGRKTIAENPWKRLLVNNPKRGDFSVLAALGVYAINSAVWISISAWLVEGFPWMFFAFYAIVYTPLISYATAKLEGLCGMAVTVPMIREVTYILSGYRGVRIWFAPAPLYNYGVATVGFRVLELTGTKLKSIVKTQMVTLPIIIVSSLVFSEILWRMAPVPSDAYPFANRMWELQAKNMALTFSATMEGGSLFMEALKGHYVLWGLGFGTVAFMVLSMFGLPTLLIFGLVQGMGSAINGVFLLSFVGAITGRFYLQKRFGRAEWLRYAPVLLAGYSCGMGLISMLSVAITMLTKMVKPLVF